MSYLPFGFDFDQHRRTSTRYMPFMPETLFDPIDTSDMDYFPKLSKWNGSQKTRKDRFEIYLDVEDYGPDDIRVKTVEGFVIVEGVQKEKRDECGWVKRQFNRRCPLPKGYKTKALLSQYSAEGTLIITAALVKSDDAKCEVPPRKRQEGEKTPAEEKPDAAKPGDDANESEKKPVKSKPDMEVVIDIVVVKENPTKLNDAAEVQAEAVLVESKGVEE